MPFAIHVPSGCSARIGSNTAVLEITGLYAEGLVGVEFFVVCASQDRASLTFANESTTAAQVLEEWEWSCEGEMPSSCTNLIFFREAGGKDWARKVLRDDYERFQIRGLSELENGAFVSLKAMEDGKASKQKGAEPEVEIYRTGVLTLGKGAYEGDLARHPQERQFIATQAIHTILATPVDGRDHVIFDGKHWESMPDSVTKPDRTTSPFQLLAGLITENQPTAVATSHIEGLIQKHNSTWTPSRCIDMADRTAPAVVDLINEYNGDLMFQVDMAHLISTLQDYEKAKEDMALEQEILDTMSSNPSNEPDEESCFTCNRIKSILSLHMPDVERSPWIADLMDGYGKAARQFYRTLKYSRMDKELENRRATARKFSKQGTELFKKKEYTAAMSKFLQCLNEATHYCTKGEPELSSTYYNIGRGCQERRHFPQALFFLDTCLQLRTHFETASEGDGIKKAQTAIDKVRESLKQPPLYA